MLTLDSVWKSNSESPPDFILKNCSFSFRERSIYAVVGASGIGKTTLLRVLNNLTSIDRGRILLEGQDISMLHPSEVRRRISMLFQTPAFVGDSVRENLDFAARFARRNDTDFSTLMEMVHLDHTFLDRTVVQLSVGQQQRVCLARTLVTKPDILLLDEPTSALDDKTADGILELVREISQQEEFLTIFVTHRRSHARKLGQVILEMAEGTLRSLS
ncbi:MAG: ABC transporter ATP-binding protein [Fidelibacterota bacterium]|nr:MAG: ABC transporter ATP-binding protein [Candidatus Neomarinimicrobiota bacterium]